MLSSLHDFNGVPGRSEVIKDGDTFIVRERNPGINAGSVEWDLRALIDRYDQKDIGVIMDPVNIKVCQRLDAASILKVLAACPEVKESMSLEVLGSESCRNDPHWFDR